MTSPCFFIVTRRCDVRLLCQLSSCLTNDVIVNTVTPLMSMECKGPEIPRTSHKPPSRGRARRCGLTLTVAACEAVVAARFVCM